MKFAIFLILPLISNTYSLSQLEEMVKKNNPQVKLSVQEVKVNAEKFDSVKHKKFTPDFDGTFVVGPVPRARGTIVRPRDKTGDIEGLGPFFRVEIELFQPIYTFGRIKNAERAAEYGVKASEWESKKVLYESIRNLRKAYLTYLYIEEMVRFVKELEDNYNKVYERAKSLYEKESGEITESDILRLENFGEMLKVEKEKVYMEREKVLEGIKLLSGIEGEAEFEVFELPIFKFEDRGEEFYLQSALSQRTEIKALKELEEASEAKLKAMRAEYFPVVFFGGKFGYSVAPNRDPQTNPWANEEFNYIVVGGVLGIKQNFDFHHIKDKVDETMAELEKVRAQLSAVKSGIREEVRENYLSVKRLSNMVDGLHRAMNKARSLFFSTLLNYEMGVVEVDEVIDRFKDYIDGKTAYLTGILQYDMKVIDLFSSSALYEINPFFVE